MSRSENLTMRDAFISELFIRARQDKDIILISNDFGAPSLDIYREELPKQYINAGISEQNIISFATGMALEGKKIFIYSIASFITLRCYEQLKLDMCVHGAPVTIIAVGSCYGYPQDGPTHHATEDIALMRALAHLQVFSPADSQAAKNLVDVSLNSKKPCYIRLEKGVFPVITSLETHESGLEVLKNGKDLCIVSTGIMSHRALEVSHALSQKGVECRVVDLCKIKPLDHKALQEALKDTTHIVTLEEHTIHGGIGSLLAEFVVDQGLMVQVKRIGISDQDLYTYGIRETLHQKLGLDKESLLKTILLWLGRG